jgi:SAM-dependent methyltransferase
MRDYWDERARTNAAWYVDTSIDFAEPDMDRFFATGETIVGEALDGAPASPPAYGVAVEIGAGLGRVCRALAARFERVVGVDVSPEMVARARELVPDDRITFELNDGVTLPVPDAHADLVVSFTVFQHIPKLSLIRSYVREAARVLRPGGLFAFQWNNLPGPTRWRVRRAVLSALQRTGVRRETHGRNAAEFLGSRVPLPAITAALRESGFEVRGMRGTGTMFAWAWATRVEDS